jgi:ubiquinone/menaquinone biosynthesis C-methylase UbiE
VTIILNEISQEGNKKISILEFGCWWWRLINHLNKNFPKTQINYTWVDISAGLIKLAQKDNPQNNFICADITEYIKKTKQESFDYIIWTESFQHIPTLKERFFLMKNFYRILKYDGKIIMTNWWLSNRFIKKYYKNILNSVLKYITSFWKKSPRDVFVPWKSTEHKKELRFYHIFWLNELENLARLSWFIISKIWYIQKDNSVSNERKNARTSLLVASKRIFNPTN